MTKFSLLLSLSHQFEINFRVFLRFYEFLCKHQPVYDSISRQIRIRAFTKEVLSVASKLPISLCMIVKNEEAFLDASLKSVVSVLGLNDIVVVDTGSTDKTKEIALDNGAHVFDFEWCDDFSAARNFSTGKAKYDWVLALDADEVIQDADIGELKSLVDSASTNSVGSIKVISLPGNASSNISRFFNRRYHKWDGNIHEQVVPIDNNSKSIIPLHLIVSHYGYTPEVKKEKKKFERNLRMLEEALRSQPDDPYLLAQIGKCYYVNGEDLVKACEYFEKALAANEDHRLEYIYITVEYYGYSLLNTGQYEKALEHILRYAGHYNVKPEFRFLSAHVYQNNAMFQEAVESYESCIGADIYDNQGITSFLSYYNIGVILECVGMIEDAVAYYDKCGDYEPALKRLTELGLK